MDNIDSVRMFIDSNNAFFLQCSLIEGNAQGASAEVLAEFAGLIDQGILEIPIARVYPLEDVQDAYRELERRHTLGKIVLVP